MVCSKKFTFITHYNYGLPASQPSVRSMYEEVVVTFLRKEVLYMTHNQIAWQNALETVRSNLAREQETRRHNLIGEQETGRHNVRVEDETHRHNTATERVSILDLNEKVRHNVRSEHLNERDINERIRHNRVAEYWNSLDTRERSRHNRMQESLNTQELSERRRDNIFRNEMEVSAHNERVRDNRVRAKNMARSNAISAFQAREQRRSNRARERLRASEMMWNAGAGLVKIATTAGLFA